MTRRHAVMGWLGAALLAAATPVAAQTAQTERGPMVVERARDGLTAAPVFRFGKVDDENRVLVGGEAGWVFDQRLMVGAGGYGMVNGGPDEVIGYGGVIVAWQFLPASSPIRFGVKTLIGGGTATLPADLGTLPPGVLPGRGSVRPGTRILVRDDYAVFEPEFTVTIRMSDLVHVSVGAAYRTPAGAGLLDDRLNGPTASLAVHFGGW